MSGPPATINGVLAAMRKDPELSEGHRALEERKGEFDSRQQFEFAAIAAHPPARAHFDAELDRIWAGYEPPTRAEEVVIGAGFHAAVYCAVRVAMGKPKPLVIERSERVGGSFAVSTKPSFYLNSRNRPGGLGIPGRGEALNVLPGAPIQPAHLSGDEYQRNSDLAFAIRATLAMNARVVTGREIRRIARSGYGQGAYLYREPSISSYSREVTRYTRRLLFATGLGTEARPPCLTDSILTFSDLMARMDEPFPLRGLGRVAVVGAGDSGKTAIEALIGQGPQMGMSSAALDHLERIDWYGVASSCSTGPRWQESARSRYAGIARYLPSGSNGRDRNNPPRIRPTEQRVDQVATSYDGVRLNGKPYDHVIWCTGWNAAPLAGSGNNCVYADQRPIAGLVGSRQYAIGPAAQLPMDAFEQNALPANLPENAVALFRYAERTATFAANVERYEAGSLS
jgi:hypothetical protein